MQYLKDILGINLETYVELDNMCHHSLFIGKNMKYIKDIILLMNENCGIAKEGKIQKYKSTKK